MSKKSKYHRHTGPHCNEPSCFVCPLLLYVIVVVFSVVLTL